MFARVSSQKKHEPLSRAERLRALSKQARAEHARTLQAASPILSTTHDLELENSQLRQQIGEADQEVDSALQQVQEANKVKSAALHELEKYQLAFEQLQLRVAELEGGTASTSSAPRAAAQAAAAPPPPPQAAARPTDPRYQTPGGTTGTNDDSKDGSINSRKTAYTCETPSAHASVPATFRRGLQATPSAMNVLTSSQTVVKTPRLHLAGTRRRHGESMYDMGSNTHINSDAYNSANYKNSLMHSGRRPRFFNSCNYHDPRDLNHDYSQSISPSRMRANDNDSHQLTSPKNILKIPITSKKDVDALVQLSTGSGEGEGMSLYHAALQSSPMKMIAVSQREKNNRLSHTGTAIKKSMPEEHKPHLLNFHRRADEVLGDRHSYQNVHHGLEARGVFQSVKNR